MSLRPLDLNTFDINRYLGKWYHFASDPHFHDPLDAHTITDTYTILPDGSINYLSQMYRYGKPHTFEGKLVPVTKNNKKTEFQVTVNNSFVASVMKLFYFPNYIIEGILGDYQIALVGSKDDSYLFIISRKPTLTCAEQQAVKDYSTKLGYEWKHLKFVRNLC